MGGCACMRACVGVDGVPVLHSVGLGMYDSPLFLPTHEESPGGRSVPTTPLQVAAPGMCASNANTHVHVSMQTHPFQLLGRRF